TRIDRYGAIGDAQPAIASVRDVPADQGGHLKITWNATYLDSDPTFAIGNYWIWRAAPPATALQSGSEALWADRDPAGPAAMVTASQTIDASPSVHTPSSALSGGRRLFRHDALVASAIAWEFVASQPANGSSQYSYVASTISDSVGGYNPRTAFMVEARDANGVAFWDSAPDSGYSVDNIAPTSPGPLTGAYGAGAPHLHWGKNGESDLKGYRIYRGSSAGFVPGPGNLIASPPDTGYADVGPSGRYYKLSAVDVHGNESAHSLLTPSATTDA